MGGDCPTRDLAWFSMSGTDLSNGEIFKDFFNQKKKKRSRKNRPEQ
jgi:hypothetical protein